jgi:hypothetical protein
MQNLGLIKICVDPHCEAVYHNIPKKETKCKDCGGRIRDINDNSKLSDREELLKLIEVQCYEDVSYACS